MMPSKGSEGRSTSDDPAGLDPLGMMPLITTFYPSAKGVLDDMTGMTLRAQDGIRDRRKMCEEELNGRYDLELIDAHRRPELAVQERLIGVPALIKKLPLPPGKLVGGMSSKEKVIVGSQIRPEKKVNQEGPK